MIGYFYFVDLWGGRPRKVYQIIGENGGVAYERDPSSANRKAPDDTQAALAVILSEMNAKD